MTDHKLVCWQSVRLPYKSSQRIRKTAQLLFRF